MIILESIVLFVAILLGSMFGYFLGQCHDDGIPYTVRKYISEVKANYKFYTNPNMDTSSFEMASSPKSTYFKVIYYFFGKK